MIYIPAINRMGCSEPTGEMDLDRMCWFFRVQILVIPLWSIGLAAAFVESFF